ncbi:hypothetical protein GQ472_01420, partial [archaeon]|nr:hypothetical protein [archaeon]
LDAIREYSGGLPKGSKKFLKKYVEKQLLKDTLKSEEIKEMHKAWELYMDAESDNDESGKSFASLLSLYADDFNYIGAVKERMIYQAELLIQRVDEKSPDSKNLKDYLELYELFFVEESERADMQNYIREEVFDSVFETEIVPFSIDYKFTWDGILAKMKAFAAVYPDSGGASKELLTEFKGHVKTRILDEAEQLNVDSLGFLRDVLKDKELIASFESNFSEWYGMKYRSYEDTGESGLLQTARRYNEVFGEYPSDFFDEFQDTLVRDFKLCVDTYGDGGLHLNRELDANVREVKLIMKELKDGELEILPDVEKTLKEINDSQPMLYQKLTSINFENDE